MDTLPDSLHSWHLADTPSGAASDDASVAAALSLGHATLTYGEHCFELTYTIEESGACFLRLEEVGRLTRTGSGRSILVFEQDGYSIDRRVVPCRDGFDAMVLPDIDAAALQAIGLALLDDAARDLDEEER